MAFDGRFDVVVVGAGPAGLSAAVAASAGGNRVGLVDENPAMGGQIWRGEPSPGRPDRLAGSLFAVVGRAGVEFLSGTRILAQPAPGRLLAETPEGCLTMSYGELILAPGARERFLPFPGWTLPNVMGAGGLQALVKSGLSVAGKSVVVAGSGPLLLAVAVLLRRKGAKVAAIAEQSPRARVVGFGLGLAASPGKLTQAVGLMWGLRGVPYRFGCWPAVARGDGRVESVTLSDGRTSWDLPCDYLACGFGLVPNTELPRALGCETSGGAVVVDGFQQTTVEGVYCVGEATGVGGLGKSLVEGKIAGHAASGNLDAARRLWPAREAALRFASKLDRAFTLRDELRALPRPDTVVCRCEDVTFSQLAPYGSAREAKLQTRCGMGPCQGRVCGPAFEFLKGWPPDSVRTPVFPARLGSLTGAEGEPPDPGLRV